jgi:hypothetical protein
LALIDTNSQGLIGKPFAVVVITDAKIRDDALASIPLDERNQWVVYRGIDGNVYGACRLNDPWPQYFNKMIEESAGVTAA